MHTVCGLRVRLLETLPRLDFIISNPPYISDAQYGSLPTSVRDYEPRDALFGGESGLEVYRRLIPEISSRLFEGGYLLIEAGLGQAQEIGRLVEKSRLSLQSTLNDLQGIPRCLVGRKISQEK